MRKHFACTFLLGDGSSPCHPEVSDFAGLCRNWALSPRAGTTDLDSVPDPLDLSDGALTYPLGQNASFSTLAYSDESQQCFGMRLSHPDREDPTINWRSELCLTVDNNGPARVSITVFVSRTTGGISPVTVAPSRPRIAKDIVDRWTANEGLLVEPTPLVVSREDTNTLVNKIRSADRRLPLLFVSARNFDDKPIVDANYIAEQLVGLCHVAVADSRFPSLALKDELGQIYNCWDGAIRIYWPGFKDTDHPFRHRLWTPNRVRDIEVSSGRFGRQMLGLLSRVAATQFVHGQVSWNSIERLIHQRVLRKAREAGDLNAFVEMADTEIKHLTAEKDALEQQLAEAQDKLEQKTYESEAHRLAYVEACRLAKGKPADELSFTTVAPASVEEVVARITEEFPNDVSFALNSRSQVEDNPFEDCDELYAAMRFLATTYLRAKKGEEPCADLDLACREASGFFYEANQSEKTMGMYKDYYHATWQDQSIVLKHHIGKGSSKDARYTIRIAFDFDDNSKTVVIGYLGQHQKTRST